MRDAVTEITIENPVAKEVFIRWWRTMEAQGYQYGFEALCNVWVGFDDGRADLARMVLEGIDNHPRFSLVTKSDVSAALRELFVREGVTTTKGDR